MCFLCLFGKGTKISKYLIEHDKEYEFALKLGIKTDTGDMLGNVLEKKDVNLYSFDIENIINILDKFKGKQMQIPPIYSAIKLNRKKAL